MKTLFQSKVDEIIQNVTSWHWWSKRLSMDHHCERVYYYIENIYLYNMFSIYTNVFVDFKPK